MTILVASLPSLRSVAAKVGGTLVQEIHAAAPGAAAGVYFASVVNVFNFSRLSPFAFKV